MNAADRLAAIRARADKALDGPWERRVAPDDPATMADKSAWVDGTLRDNGEPIHLAIAAPPNDELAYVVPFLTGDGPTSRANAEFIAHARADVPALVSALLSVLDLHRPNPLGSLATCERCRDLRGSQIEYPCPTVRAVEAALGEVSS
ncbi:hypothetical protein [Dietzia sp. MNB45]|uniref:hypothetical protein n=1 Tax=Dietzia sp. MNB45 TaxID=3238800 RepID=UPI003F7D82D9